MQGWWTCLTGHSVPMERENLGLYNRWITFCNVNQNWAHDSSCNLRLFTYVTGGHHSAHQIHCSIHNRGAASAKLLGCTGQCHNQPYHSHAVCTQRPEAFAHNNVIWSFPYLSRQTRMKRIYCRIREKIIISNGDFTAFFQTSTGLIPTGAWAHVHKRYPRSQAISQEIKLTVA